MELFADGGRIIGGRFISFFFSTFETELAGVDVNYLSCSREKLCMPIPVNRVAKREKENSLEVFCILYSVLLQRLSKEFIFFLFIFY